MNPQALRGYEAKGLVDPARTDCGTRRYSGHDIDRINKITALLEDGLNLAGVARVRQLEAELSHLRRQGSRESAREDAGWASTALAEAE